MPNPSIQQGDQEIFGNLTVHGSIALDVGLARTSIQREDLKSLAIPTESFRIWDAFQTSLTTAAADDLGITTGTFGTGLPYLTSGDCKATTATRYARALITLPPEYVSATDISLRLATGMLTTISDTTATIDAEVYKSNRDTTKTGSDLVSTSATSINSLTFAEKLFTIAGGALSAGSVLDIRVAIAIVDAATGTAVIGAIAHAELLMSIKG